MVLFLTTLDLKLSTVTISYYLIIFINLLKIDFNFNHFPDFDYYYEMIRSQKKEYIDTGAAAKEFLSTNLKEKFKVFQKYIAAGDDAKTMLSERAQDPGWFEGEGHCDIK